MVGLEELNRDAFEQVKARLGDHHNSPDMMEQAFKAAYLQHAARGQTIDHRAESAFLAAYTHLTTCDYDGIVGVGDHALKQIIKALAKSNTANAHTLLCELALMIIQAMTPRKLD